MKKRFVVFIQTIFFKAKYMHMIKLAIDVNIKKNLAYDFVNSLSV